jgi:hypothetical protein
MKFQHVEGGLDGLKTAVAGGQREFAILLNGGAYSRKTIRRKGRRWYVTNHIDDSKQQLTDEQLWTESMLGEAIDKEALVAIVDWL